MNAICNADVITRRRKLAFLMTCHAHLQYTRIIYSNMTYAGIVCLACYGNSLVSFSEIRCGNKAYCDISVELLQTIPTSID